MTDFYSKKAKWAEIENNEEALEYHAARFLGGARDDLARLSFQKIKTAEAQNVKGS
jgi:hypothetical protein